MMVRPAASTTSAPAGISVVARGPAATMRSSGITITESAISARAVDELGADDGQAVRLGGRRRAAGAGGQGDGDDTEDALQDLTQPCCRAS